MDPIGTGRCIMTRTVALLMTVTMLRRAVSRFLRPGGWSIFTREGPGVIVSGQWRGASLVVVNNYASISKKTREFPSQLDDLSPTMLKKDYKDLEIMNTTNDVVLKLLSLEMATHKEKLKLKTSQLVEKVQRSPSDVGSTEVQIAILTAKIRNYQEHLQVHRKDSYVVPVIYKIPCKDCRKHYVVQTGRKLAIKIHKHQLAAKRYDQLSLISIRTDKEEHQFDWSPIHQQTKTHK
ncbi:28S ribosomal protein S15, mitochondrial isoform X2 [Rhincodon typus]|uniref:28S ribosomal protein S15, mitochondrial isoform X2 n=1 Tax=Rhincodon typus TaxID=259920 RepID=UPI002030A620|nr:28S ribosomal protein S15, mitochondrial isoform X2 [Rhincodon typus]